MAMHDRLQTVQAYLRGNGVSEGFLEVQLPDSPAEKTTFNIAMLSRRITHTAVFGSSGIADETPQEIVAVFDVRLHGDPPGLIKCPYLILGRNAGDKKYVNLTLKNWNDIANVIDTLQDEEAVRRNIRVTREVMAFYVATGSWSGIRPVTIAESRSGNFQLADVRDFFQHPEDVVACVLDLSPAKPGRRLLGVYDKKHHNDGTDDCPYLVFTFGFAYKVHDIKEDQMIDVADAIEKLREEVPCDDAAQ